MKIRRPWFKFYPGDWLSSRTVCLMTPAQKGVYIDLLSLCWQEGSIPADPDELAFLLRLSKREFRPLWETVSKHFHPTVDPHFLTNRRIEDERTSAQSKSEKGRKAANSRWDNDADALQTQCEPNATRAFREERGEAEEREEKREAHAGAFDFEAIYLAYPGKSGKAKGLEALRKAIKSRDQYDAVLRAATTYGEEERRFKASGSKAFRPEVPYFSTWVNARRWEDHENTATLFAKVKSPAQLLAEESRQQRLAEFEGQQ